MDKLIEGLLEKAGELLEKIGELFAPPAQKPEWGLIPIDDRPRNPPELW